MNVMDNILMEWAYRCPDGIVDINNPEKSKILLEILNEISSKQELVDLINTVELTPEQISKLGKYVSNKVSPSDTNVKLEKIFAQKGLKRIGPLVIYLANNFDVEDKLVEYITNLENGEMSGKSEPILGDKGNLFTLFAKSGLPEDFIKKLTQTTSTQLGAGELLLVTMLKDAEKVKNKSGQGDIKVGGKIIELKGKGAALSEWGSKAPIKAAFNKTYGEEYIKTKDLSGSKWLKELSDDLKNENKDKAETVLKELYPDSEFELDIPNLIGIDKKDIRLSTLEKNIANGFADQYFKNSKVDFILVLDETTGDYQKFDKEGFKAALGNKIQYTFTKDTAPRIFLNSTIE